MKPLHTHYDNLKVARDAPLEVIRAAYKTLSQKYHPDRNPGSAEAARIMTLINASYAVLTDHAKRREHDHWVRAQETTPASNYNAGHSQPRPANSSSRNGELKNRTNATLRVKQAAVHIANHWRAYLLTSLGLFVVYSTYNEKAAPPPPGPKPYTTTAPSEPTQPPPEQEVPKYIRPVMAPNGRPWPLTAGLLTGFSRLNTDGHSSVTIDNTGNRSDVYVKLVSLSGPRAYPVRVFYIPATGKYTLKNLTSGAYDIRYRDLDSGELSRTESFDLKEQPIFEHGENGIEYTTLSFSLYKVRNGNAQTYPLSESEF